MTFGYDAWGNMTSKSDGTSSATYSWHYGGKLTGVTSTFPREGSGTYNYGGDQKRRERNDGTTDTQYNWDAGWSLINEENGAGALTMTYVRAPMGLVGPVLADIAGSTPASGTYRYYALDNLGSTRSLWDNSKASLGSHAYTPYGGIYSTSGQVALPMFTGHQWDDATGMYVAPYRFYNPEGGRWVSRDPLGMVDGPNLYGYAGSNPVSLMDPLGLVVPGDPDPSDEIIIAVLLSGAIRSALAAGRAAAKKAFGTCKNIRCKAALHGAHHTFPGLGKKCHIQVTCWIKGKKGSSVNLRVPVPNALCPKKKPKPKEAGDVSRTISAFPGYAYDADDEVWRY